MNEKNVFFPIDHTANCPDMDQSIFAGSRKHLWYEKSRRQEPLVYYSVWACNYTIDQDSKYIIFFKEFS